MDALTRFIHRTGGEPWVYGVSDCAPWLLRWVTERTGKTAPVPDYNSALGALRLIRVHGGVLPLYRLYAARMGLPEADEARRGDVGVIAAEGALTGLTGGICMSPGTWAAKLHDGRVKLVRADPLAIWSV